MARLTTKERLSAASLATFLTLGALSGCGTCDAGQECAENAASWQRVGEKVSKTGGDIVEIGSDLTGRGLQILGEGMQVGGKWGGEGVRKSGRWLAEKTKPWANFRQALRMGFEKATR